MGQNSDVLDTEKLLLKDEHELVKSGNLEVPELTNYTIADDQYLN